MFSLLISVGACDTVRVAINMRVVDLGSLFIYASFVYLAFQTHPSVSKTIGAGAPGNGRCDHRFRLCSNIGHNM